MSVWRRLQLVACGALLIPAGQRLEEGAHMMAFIDLLVALYFWMDSRRAKEG